MSLVMMFSQDHVILPEKPMNPTEKKGDTQPFWCDQNV